MSIRMQPSKFGTSPAPNTQGYTPGVGETFLRGAVVTYVVASDDVDEHAGGGVVTLVLGIAAHDVTAGVSDDVSGNVLVYKALDQEFAGSALTAGSAVATDLSGVSIGDVYGIIKHADNEWYVDLGDVGNPVLTISKIIDLTGLHIVLFRFLLSAVQEV